MNRIIILLLGLVLPEVVLIGFGIHFICAGDWFALLEFALAILVGWQNRRLLFRRCRHKNLVWVGDCGDRAVGAEIVRTDYEGNTQIHQITVETVKVKCLDCGEIFLRRATPEEVLEAVRKIERGEA